MSKKILVNATHPEENRVAIVENGVLTELDIEVASREPTKGNIYKAVVVRVESGLQAAFVDYGAERLGFLQIDEINFNTVKPDFQSEENRRPRINDLLQRGQEVLVQITKEERGTKGAALTTYLSLAGRYMVLMPGSQTRGVSRKAESDSQRKELKKAMSSIDLAEGVGYIVRTAALDQSREELERDYRYLIRLYESINDLGQKVKAPALIYKESNLIIRSIRDYFTTDMDEVLIDDPEMFKEAKDFFQMVMPDHVNLVKLHQERRPIFSRYQIEDQIETLSRNKVTLPSGGSIVIDPTEALVAIDVNSGKMASEQGVEATATKTNLEAAEEVGRQLRLRDLGGLIVIDFIDMRERKHMRQVENQLKKSLENDKARVSVGRISQFGLLEMSRQRIKSALTEGSYLTCPHCNGSGHLKSPETQAVALLRKIHASAAKGQVSRVDAQLPMDVAAYLLNNKREELVDMERRYQLQIHIHGNRDFVADQIEIEIQKKEKEKAAQPGYIAAGMIPHVVEEQARQTPAKPEEPRQESDEPVQKEAVEAEADPAKKRRRRRNRKPATAEGEEQPAGLEAPSPESKDLPSEVESKKTQDKPVALPVESLLAEGEKPAGKPVPESTDATAGLTTKPEESREQGVEPVQKEAVEAEADPAKKRRRRRRRKPAAAGSAEASAMLETPSPGTGDLAAGAQGKEAEDKPVTHLAGSPLPEIEKTAENPVPDATSTPDAAPTKPKRRRSRRKPKAAGSTSPAETTSPVAEPEQQDKPAIPDDQPMSLQAGEPGPKAATKPKQRRTRRVAKKPEPESPAVEKGPEQAVQPPVPVQGQPPEDIVKTEEIPKKRRSSRATPKPKATESKTPEASANKDKAAETKAATTKPADSNSITSPKGSGPAVDGVPAVTEKDRAGDKPQAEKPKPKSRRPARKKPAKAEPEVQG